MLSLRRLDEARHLAQLGHDAPGALGERRVVEQRLAGEARRQDVGVVLRIALPRCAPFELEEPRADIRIERRALEPLDVGQPRGIDGREPAREPAEVANLRVDGLPAEILEQVIVEMHAVEGGVGRVDFVEIREIFVDKVGKGFG